MSSKKKDNERRFVFVLHRVEDKELIEWLEERKVQNTVQEALIQYKERKQKGTTDDIGRSTSISDNTIEELTRQIAELKSLLLSGVTLNRDEINNDEISASVSNHHSQDTEAETEEEPLIDEETRQKALEALGADDDFADED